VHVQTRHPLIRDEQAQARVTPLELFFDLVFVFALTQVTAYMADELNWQGILRGALVIMLLWWAWTGYAWLANVASAEEPPIKLSILAGMSAMFVLALCIPEAFDDAPGGLNGPVVLAVCYLLFRFMHFVMFMIVARDDPGLRSQLLRFAPSVLVGSAVLLVASQYDGWAQTALWMLALVADYVGTALGGFSGWRLPAPRHFSERHGLILIVALGESIVAIGVGSDSVVNAGIVVGAVLGVVVCGALWWLYFDVVALVAERRLSKAAPGRERNSIGRDSYGYLHLPMVAGIVLLALGFKKTLGHVGEALEVVPATAMLGGTALYLVAHVAFRLRNVHRFSLQRLLCAIALVALIPAAVELPALATLGILAALLVVLIVYESVRFAELRDRMRHVAEG
jgi:low temperature requirement protein LtrA